MEALHVWCGWIFDVIQCDLWVNFRVNNSGSSNARDFTPLFLCHTCTIPISSLISFRGQHQTLSQYNNRYLYHRDYPTNLLTHIFPKISIFHSPFGSMTQEIGRSEYLGRYRSGSVCFSLPVSASVTVLDFLQEIPDHIWESYSTPHRSIWVEKTNLCGPEGKLWEMHGCAGRAVLLFQDQGSWKSELWGIAEHSFLL